MWKRNIGIIIFACSFLCSCSFLIWHTNVNGINLDKTKWLYIFIVSLFFSGIVLFGYYFLISILLGASDANKKIIVVGVIFAVIAVYVYYKNSENLGYIFDAIGGCIFMFIVVKIFQWDSKRKKHRTEFDKSTAYKSKNGEYVLPDVFFGSEDEAKLFKEKPCTIVIDNDKVIFRNEVDLEITVLELQISRIKSLLFFKNSQTVEEMVDIPFAYLKGYLQTQELKEIEKSFYCVIINYETTNGFKEIVFADLANRNGYKFCEYLHNRYGVKAEEISIEDLKKTNYVQL